jgi:hypothetical protein
VEQVLFNNRSGVAKIRYDVAFDFAQRKLYKITVSGVSKIVQHWRVWFCATKIVQNNRQLTVTTAYLQHRDCRYSVS